jgi:hypothetical protein
LVEATIEEKKKCAAATHDGTTADTPYPATAQN